MALPIWQQILLSDPNNTEALAGVARDLRLNGSIRQSEAVLDQLRKINPSDPNIGRIEGILVSDEQQDRLRQAGELAAAGKNEDAMRLYRDLYGTHPPDGDIGLAYYETLYGAIDGKQEAIQGLRALSMRNPGDPRYATALGRMLSYDPRTRAEGMRILQAHSSDADARDALRQVLLWDAGNPNIADELKAYLKSNPGDSVIASRLQEYQAELAQTNSGIARNAAEQAAFAALNSHRLDVAQQRFLAILDKDPKNPRAAAGMGFLRMQQSNFAAAVSYLTQAEDNGYEGAAVEDALKSSRFWYTISVANDALANNQLALAAATYQKALIQRPHSPEALTGLAHLNLRAQQYGKSAAIYEQLVSIVPRDPDAWRGLFLSYARNGETQKALALADHIPASVRPMLERDPAYLRTLATLNQQAGRAAMR
jgi:tetratricopeptide (TPR) repeat protein